MKTLNVKWKKIRNNAYPLKYAHGDGDSGFDLRSCIDITIAPYDVIAIPTGWACSIPEGYELQIRSKSGLACRDIICNNSPGTVDSCYRGEIMVIIKNQTSEPFTFNEGDKIAQGVLCNVYHTEFTEVNELDDTNRGNQGFGSTGK